MKRSINTTLNMALLAGTLALAPGLASAAVPPLNILDVPGVTSGSVHCVLKGGVATLSGTVQSRFERKQIEKYVKRNYEVDRVINLITTSN